MFRRRHMMVLALALATGACEDPGGSDSDLPPFTPGAYTLVSIGGKPLPTSEPCSGLRADEERFTLNADRTAEWVFRLTHLGTGQQSTYAAAGTYASSDETELVSVNLTYTAGSASRSPFVFELRRTEEGLTRTVGDTCGGAPEVKLYRLP